MWNDPVAHKIVQGFYTKPEKPINAIAKIPAVMSAMGTPFTPLGTPTISNLSRMPAIMTSASAKPIAIEVA